MSYKVEMLELRRIYLDNDNPRHDPIAAEPEIIRHLLAKEDIKPLAKHIAKAGRISPLERIAVVPHPKVKDAYITAEGNRRICSLKLLGDPDKADNEANREYFRGLVASMDSPPKLIEAVIFSSKQESRPWVSLRHEGAQGGVGTKTWNSKQKTRFNSQGELVNSPNLQALLLIEYAELKELLDADQIARLKLTTVTRYLSNPIFRETLGLVDHRTLTISVPRDEFERTLTHFLRDTLDPDSNVNSRSSKSDRIKYAQTLRTEGIAPTTRGCPPADLNAPAPEVKPEKKPLAPQRRDNRSPDDRPRVIPAKFTARINDKILKRLYDELKSADAEDYSFSCTYLLRAVIERMTVLYLQQHRLSNPPELHNKLAVLEKALEQAQVPDRHRKVLRVMAGDKEHRLSPETIGHFVHGGAVPTRTDVIRTWDSLEGIMTHVFSVLK